LWLGTAEGLVRYDSTHFTTLIIRDGLAKNFVTSLQEEPTTSHLWLANYQSDRSVRMAPITTFQALPPSWQPQAPSTPDTARLHAYLRCYPRRLIDSKDKSLILAYQNCTNGSMSWNLGVAIANVVNSFYLRLGSS
jgi:hypothetical protein